MPHCQINKLRLPAAGLAKAKPHCSYLGNHWRYAVPQGLNIQPLVAFIAQGIVGGAKRATAVPPEAGRGGRSGAPPVLSVLLRTSGRAAPCFASIHGRLGRSHKTMHRMVLSPKSPVPGETGDAPRSLNPGISRYRRPVTTVDSCKFTRKSGGMGR